MRLNMMSQMPAILIPTCMPDWKPKLPMFRMNWHTLHTTWMMACGRFNHTGYAGRCGIVGNSTRQYTLARSDVHRTASAPNYPQPNRIGSDQFDPNHGTNLVNHSVRSVEDLQHLSFNVVTVDEELARRNRR